MHTLADRRREMNARIYLSQTYFGFISAATINAFETSPILKIVSGYQMQLGCKCYISHFFPIYILVCNAITNVWVALVKTFLGVYRIYLRPLEAESRVSEVPRRR